MILTKFNADSRVEVFPYDSIKTYDYNAIACYQAYLMIMPIVNSIQSIDYIFCRSLNDVAIPDFINTNENILIRAEQSRNLKILNDELEEEGVIVPNKAYNGASIAVNKSDSIKETTTGMKCSFFVVNYNTSKLINILIKSIHKFVHSFEYDIWIFDNSDKEALSLEGDWKDVHILDNTKGQLIDYPSRLKKLTDSRNSEWTAGFISLKHALAIDYGLNCDFISDDFILCDSDVILLKDLDFIDKSFITAGYMREKPGDVPRIVPFINYINRSLMRQYGIKYFDSNRFHGCIMKNGQTKRGYDTGASFYEDINKKNPRLFKKIKLDDYIFHLGGGSRNDKYAIKLDLNVDDIAAKLGLDDDSVVKPMLSGGMINETLRFDFTNLEICYDGIKRAYEIQSPTAKNVVYTAIIGDYDNIKELAFYDFGNFDYICFTNSKKIKSSNWKIIDVSDFNNYLKINDNTKEARFFKTHPHLFFKKYKRSIWIDGNVNVKCKNINDEFLPLLGKGEYLLTMEHPFLDNVYDEYDKILACKKESSDVLKRTKDLLMLDKFNDKGRHVQTNILLRDHNNKECIRLMEAWWQMILRHSRRDQMSFNYVFERFFGKFTIVPAKIMTERYFYIASNHSIVKRY